MIEGAFKPFAEQAEFSAASWHYPRRPMMTLPVIAMIIALSLQAPPKRPTVSDLKAAIQKVHDEGKSIQWFRQEFASIVQQRGWQGWTGQGTQAGEAWHPDHLHHEPAHQLCGSRYAQMTDRMFWLLAPIGNYVHLKPVPTPDRSIWPGMV